MTMNQKAEGEQRRERLVAILGEKYDAVSRDALFNIVKDEGWTAAHLDNALYVLRKLNIAVKGEVGYTLTTAPQRNGGCMPPMAVPTPNLTMEDSFGIVAGGDGRPNPEAPPTTPAALVVPTCQFPTCGAVVDLVGQVCVVHRPVPGAPGPVPDLWTPPPVAPAQIPAPAKLDVRRCPACGEGTYGPFHICTCGPQRAGIDPVAVRAALGKLQARLTVDRVVIDKELKIEVLDYLGRILDNDIEAVLVSIAGDLQK